MTTCFLIYLGRFFRSYRCLGGTVWLESGPWEGPLDSRPAKIARVGIGLLEEGEKGKKKGERREKRKAEKGRERTANKKGSE